MLITVAILLAAVAVIISGAAFFMARRALQAAGAPHSRALRELLHAVSRGDVDRLPALLRQLDLHVARLDERLTRAEGRLAAAVQKIGLVRFDAEPTLGGRVSFVLALLDERDDGVLITSLYRLEDNRVFLREVYGGRTEHELSHEEARALSMAMDEELQGRRRRHNTSTPPSPGPYPEGGQEP